MRGDIGGPDWLGCTIRLWSTGVCYDIMIGHGRFREAIEGSSREGEPVV